MIHFHSIGSLDKTWKSFVYQLFPCWTPKEVLQICYTFIVTLVERFSKHWVVSNSQGMFFVSICNISHFYGVSQNRQKMWFNEPQHHHVIRSTINTQNGINRPEEAFHPFCDRTTIARTTFQYHTQKSTVGCVSNFHIGEAVNFSFNVES